MLERNEEDALRDLNAKPGLLWPGLMSSQDHRWFWHFLCTFMTMRIENARKVYIEKDMQSVEDTLKERATTHGSAGG